MISLTTTIRRILPVGELALEQPGWRGRLGMALSRAVYARRARTVPPIVIYSFGKVGSTSLDKSLAASWKGLVVHSHNLSREKQNNLKVQVLDEVVVRRRKPLYLISLVREPIGRNVSAFFENFEREVGVRPSESKYTIEQLIEIFLTRFPHDRPLEWYEKRVGAEFGIDVYSESFPAHGVKEFHNGPVRLLLLRSEIPDARKEAAVAEFLGLDSFSVIRKNVGSEKEYAQLYRQFKQAFRAPEWYLDQMYNSKFFNHFYGEEAGRELRRRWGGHTPAAS